MTLILFIILMCLSVCFSDYWLSVSANDYLDIVIYYCNNPKSNSV